MEAGSTENSITNKKTSNEDEVLSLKRKGDEFFEDNEFEKALECCNRAIEMDDSNPELSICRAETYHKMEQYSSCVTDAEKIVEICTNKTEPCDSLLLFKALKLMAESIILSYPMNEPDYRKKLEGIFSRAMQLNVLTAEIEPLIVLYNRWKGGFQADNSNSIKAMNEGCLNYYVGAKQLAIEQFDKAIKYDGSNSLAFAYRAICFAEEADREQELISDIQKSIDLDYRVAQHLTIQVKRFQVYPRIAPCFRLMKALGLSLETYKRSIGKFFPTLLDDKPLSKQEIERCNFLNESFRSPIKTATIQGFDSDSESDSETDCSNKEAAAEKNKRKLSKQALSLKEKGDKFYEKKQLESALDCYNKAIELDKSANLELLICRAQVYHDTEKWEDCISEANKLIGLHESELLHEKCKCVPVFRAFKLMGISLSKLKGLNPDSLEAFKKALRIDVPVNDIDEVLLFCKLAKKGMGNVEASFAAFLVGNEHYLQNDKIEAIKQYNKAIEYSQHDARIYALRAACYADDDQYEQELISDVKESLELDYRLLDLLLKGCITGFESRPTGRLRLLRALSLSEETFKQSAGRIFPKILDNKRLNKHERKRFKELAECGNSEHSNEYSSLHPELQLNRALSELLV